ncbi:hypothetical protein EV424DRAFT_1342177 [Suillus variegatus]|nr:hypothetical protein EV424DRAFT_1342177 [Suillus variegatus]
MSDRCPMLRTKRSQTGKDRTWYGGSEKLERPREWADDLRTTQKNVRNLRKVGSVSGSVICDFDQIRVQRRPECYTASESDDSESCWMAEHMSSDESDEEIYAYPVYRTQKEGMCKKSEVFDGVYLTMGRDTWEAMKKEQCQRYELWGDRQYTPALRSQPLKTSNELPTPRQPNPTLPPKPTVPEGCEFKIVEPRKINESVRKSLEHPREDKENIPLRPVARPELVEREERKNESKRIWAHKKFTHVSNIDEEARYDAQDDVIIMEDDALTKRKTKELVRKLGKDDIKDAPKERAKVPMPIVEEELAV